jgi:hypothetical protein
VRATTVLRAAGPLLVTLILLAAPAADAAGSRRHSGIVVAIDPQRGVVVIEETGPGSGEKPVVTRRTIALTAGTRFRSFIRVNVLDAFAGDFIEVVLDADDVAPGDFVTAECVLERGRLVATRVTLAESAQLPSSAGSHRP